MSTTTTAAAAAAAAAAAVPSYDYTALVHTIAVAYQTQDWATVCEQSEILSQHCPMTPLLWIQYAHAASTYLGDTTSTDNDNEGDFMDTTTATDVVTPSTFESIMELGLLEYPQNSLLHYAMIRDIKLRYDKANDVRDRSHYRSRLHEALQAIGHGSHLVDPLVYELYRMALREFHHDADAEKDRLWLILEDCLKYCPLILEDKTSTGEDDDIVAKLLKDVPTEQQQRCEEARKFASVQYQKYRTYEDDIDIALRSQGIVVPQSDATEPPWWNNVNVETCTFGMGLGNVETAQAYLRYATALRKGKQLELAKTMYERAIVECPTIETLWCDYLQFVQYQFVRHNSMPTTTADEDDRTTKNSSSPPSVTLPVTSVTLESISTRAMRNCPYSLRLVQMRLQIYLLLANHHQVILDPEQLMQIVQNALNTNLIVVPMVSSSSNGIRGRLSDTGVALQLYQTVVWIMKQRILHLLDEKSSQQQQQPTGGGKNHRNDTIDNGELPGEVFDLCDDLLELYEELDQIFQKQHPQSNKDTQQARCWVYRDGSKTIQYLIHPLQHKQGDESNSLPRNNGSNNNNKIMKWAQQAVKMHQPPHPDVYIEYLHHAIHDGPTTPKQVLPWIQNIQSLFGKAVRTVGRTTTTIPPCTIAGGTLRSTTTTQLWRDYDVALHQLCHDWLEFEQVIGTEQSYRSAQESVHKKLESATAKAPPPPHVQEVSTSNTPEGSSPTKAAASRKRQDTSSGAVDSTNSSEPAAKKAKMMPEAEEEQEETKHVPATNPPGTVLDAKDSATASSPQAPPGTQPKVVHKVRVGKLDFPAHPYTVRISNLSPEAHDMDLVETFRRCGNIVHARIIRDKHHVSSRGPQQHHGVPPSKGWGLVQFEERESVEVALQLNDVIGLHEQVLKVERSHIPAALLVPPGMHRVNEKGHGKYSKRNERRKDVAHRGSGTTNSQPEHDHLPSDSAARPESNDGSGLVGGPQEQTAGPAAKESSAVAKPAASTMGVLSFRPRGVGRGGHQRPRISLPENNKK